MAGPEKLNKNLHAVSTECWSGFVSERFASEGSDLNRLEDRT